jgi:hypothetical protein
MSLRKLPTRSRALDAEYGYCVLEVAAVAVATVVSDAVEALSRLIGAVVVEVAGSDDLCVAAGAGVDVVTAASVGSLFRHCDVRCDGRCWRLRLYRFN